MLLSCTPDSLVCCRITEKVIPLSEKFFLAHCRCHRCSCKVFISEEGLSRIPKAERIDACERSDLIMIFECQSEPFWNNEGWSADSSRRGKYRFSVEQEVLVKLFS